MRSSLLQPLLDNQIGKKNQEGVEAVPLGRATVDPSRRVVMAPPSVAARKAPTPDANTDALQNSSPPSCPAGMTQLDTFVIKSTAWSACEDLQTPDGALALISSAGDSELFPKSYAPYGTNATDGEYYLGLGQEAVASAA